MKAIYYQLKNIRRDKLCILSFLLPVIVGIAINFISDTSFSSVAETSFGVIGDDLTTEVTEWLNKNGSVQVYEDIDALKTAINDPSTQMIGVVRSGQGIRTMLSGDEYKLYRIIANKLPQLYEQRELTNTILYDVQPIESNTDWLKSLLVVITMVTAMFMGCTFNAMSIIGEKEDGIESINEVLPISNKEYVFQKIILGFTGGIISTLATALICVRVGISQAIPLLLLIILSAFISALAGLFIGRFSNGLMVGIVYIKVVIILFIAPPILFYMTVPAGSIARMLTYMLPSSATFYGLMDLINGQWHDIGIYILILGAHCVIWLLVYLVTSRRKKI